MKQLPVPRINKDEAVQDLNRLSQLLDEQQKHLIPFAPWPSFPSKPEVQFSIAHTRNFLLIKFYVKERWLLAANLHYNSAVYEDSCVECFLSFNDDPQYYNLEMNCTGTLRMGYGRGRDNREFIREADLRKVARQVLINHNSGIDMIAWDLTVLLPLAIFKQLTGTELTGTRCRANFYKCGDRLPEPHFLCWSEIKAPEPDFHLPEFFGELYFQ